MVNNSKINDTANKAIKLYSNPILLKFYLIVAAILIVIVTGIVIWFIFDVNNTADAYNSLNCELNKSNNKSKDQFMAEWSDSKEFNGNNTGVDNKPGGSSGSNGTGVNKNGIQITGDQTKDNVDGYMITWTYLCSVYETGKYNISMLQGHDACKCTVGNISVPGNRKSSVAHGAFQADSGFALSKLLDDLAKAGYTDFAPLIHTNVMMYRKHESMRDIHSLFIKYKSEDYMNFLATQIRSMLPQYLPEDQLVQIETILGKDRYEIHPAIIGTIFSINIYCGGKTSTKAISGIIPTMTNTEIIDQLYTARGKVEQNGNRKHYEHTAAVTWANDPNYDIYNVNILPAKGAIDLRQQFGL